MPNDDEALKAARLKALSDIARSSRISTMHLRLFGVQTTEQFRFNVSETIVKLLTELSLPVKNLDDLDFATLKGTIASSTYDTAASIFVASVALIDLLDDSDEALYPQLTDRREQLCSMLETSLSTVNRLERRGLQTIATGYKEPSPLDLILQGQPLQTSEEVELFGLQAQLWVAHELLRKHGIAIPEDYVEINYAYADELAKRARSLSLDQDRT